MDISAVKGVIRENNILITLQCTDLNIRQIEVSIKEKSAERKIFQLCWPDDFSIASPDEGTPHLGTATIPEIGKLPLFSDVILREAGTPLPVGEEWHLTGLYAFSERQFERRFFRKKHRVSDRETLVYSLKNILSKYRLNEGHRCVVAVILSYRAVDSGEVAELKLAKQHLQKQMTATASLPTTNDVRTDREHLYISMLTALWHVNLALGEYGDFINNLDEAIAFSKSISSPMTTTSYNLSRAARCVAGYISRRANTRKPLLPTNITSNSIRKACPRSSGRPSISSNSRKPTRSSPCRSRHPTKFPPARRTSTARRSSPWPAGYVPRTPSVAC